jgi:hypothetical protein
VTCEVIESSPPSGIETVEATIEACFNYDEYVELETLLRLQERLGWRCRPMSVLL